MGFSIIGLIICLSIFIPNILFVIFTPQNVPEGLKDAGSIFTITERIGQVGCFIALIISKNNFQSINRNVWLYIMLLCIILYYILWFRYVYQGREFFLLFKPLIFLPIPMAIFPILAFVFAALWGKSILLGSFVGKRLIRPTLEFT